MTDGLPKLFAAIGSALALALLATKGGPAFAQTAPDAGSILRDLNRTTPQWNRPPVPSTPLLPEEAAPLAKQGQTVAVKAFRIQASLFPEATLAALLQDYVGRNCSLGELQEAAGKISQFYRDHDHLARAYLPRQTIRDGIVEIVVVEAKLGKISAEPADRTATRLWPEVAVGTVLAAQAVGDFLRPGALEDGLADLNALPGVKAGAVLEAGAKEGETDVLVTVADTALINGVLQLDNASVRSVGAERALLSMAVNDAVGIGDQTTVIAVKSLGSDFGRLSLSAPLGYSGLTLGVNGSALHYAVAARVNVSRPEGEATTLGLAASYPLYRDRGTALQMQSTFDHKRLVNAVSALTSSANRLDVGGLGLVAATADDWLGGGLDNVSLTGALGRLDLSGNADNRDLDRFGPRTAGVYGKAALTASRVTPLRPDTDLLVSLAGQWAAKNLDSSEKFSLGGPTAIRAYPVNEASGDEGALLSAELRHAPLEDVLVAAFFDAGVTVQSVRSWSGAARRNTYPLQGTGASASWSLTRSVQLKVTLAQRIGPNPGADAAGHDSDGRHERTRLWGQLSYGF